MMNFYGMYSDVSLDSNRVDQAFEYDDTLYNFSFYAKT